MSELVFGTPPPDAVCRDRPAAYAVIRNPQGHVAAVCCNFRGRDEFWLPGGGVEGSETPEETILREAREELDRPTRVLGTIGEAVQYFHASDDACWYRMQAVFCAAQFDSEAGPSGEYALHWIDPNIRRADFFHESHVWAALQT